MTHTADIRLIINTNTQVLTLLHNHSAICHYPISTAKNGTGQQMGSHCTPLGRHIIADKIGAHAPIGSVFVARVPTGEIYSEALALAYPDRDWILTRILRLAGTEDGFNKGIDANGISCDSFLRYIYIHGTPDDEPMGAPHSHGCIRMRNDDIIALFEEVAVGTMVEII